MTSLIFIISAPSGTGKSTLIKTLIDKKLSTSKTFTTRKIRTGEVVGEKYFFTTKEDFLKKIEHNDFLEYAEVFGNLYGTDKSYVLSELQDNKDLIIEADVQGFAQIKQNEKNLLPHRLVSIFIAPPSIAELKNRILARNDNTSDLDIRLATSRNELLQAKNYDYLVINDSFEKASSELKSIITAERLKNLPERLETLIKPLLQASLTV